jgi:phage gp36-like protein
MSTVVSYTSVNMVNITLAEIGSMGTLTNSAILTNASAAESMINAKIAHRYSIPITGVTVPVLETLATDMTIYRILTGRIIVDEEHPWFQRFKDSKNTLKDIAEGKMSLLTSSGDMVGERGDEASGSQVWTNTMDYPPTHWEGSWTSHNQDPDKIEDEADERDIYIGSRLK